VDQGKELASSALTNIQSSKDCLMNQINSLGEKSSHFSSSSSAATLEILEKGTQLFFSQGKQMEEKLESLGSFIKTHSHHVGSGLDAELIHPIRCPANGMISFKRCPGFKVNSKISLSAFWTLKKRRTPWRFNR